MVELEILKVLASNLNNITHIPNAVYVTEDGGLYIANKSGELVQIGCTRKEYEKIEENVNQKTCLEVEEW